MTNSQQMMTQVKRLFEEVYTKGNVAVMDEMFAKHFKLHDSSSPHHDSLDAYKQLEKTYSKAFPTKKAKIDDMFCFENKVVVRWTTQGVSWLAKTGQDFKEKML